MAVNARTGLAPDRHRATAAALLRLAARGATAADWLRLASPGRTQRRRQRVAP